MDCIMTDSKMLYSNHHAIVMNNIQKNASLAEISAEKSILIADKKS